MQNLIVAVVVAACTGYAVWTLIPNALRRAAAQRLQRVAWWPEPIARKLGRVAAAPTGCGCDARCDAAKPAPSTAQPIRIHRRPKA